VLSQGTLFRVEGALAIAAGVILLVWPRRLSWAFALLVAASAFGAVELYRYVDVGSLGPLPNMYEPTWAASGKLASAWAEGAATAICAVGLLLSVVSAHLTSAGRATPAVAGGVDDGSRPNGQVAPEMGIGV
jgi:hypothetical protein